MQKNSRDTLYRIVGVGLMAALAFVGSLIQIPIPTPIDNTRIHLGNVFCLLAGMLLGGARGGLAAGIGSALFDLTNPLYIAYAPFTFAFKFLMAFICGLIARRGGVARTALGAACGSLLYVALYLAQGFLEATLVLRVETETALISTGIKAATSGINAVISVAAAVPLGLALRRAIAKTDVGEKLFAGGANRAR